ncbi:hypothetical protein IAU59_007565 [Kwoniella sp. CBS 9459]
MRTAHVRTAHGENSKASNIHRQLLFSNIGEETRAVVFQHDPRLLRIFLADILGKIQPGRPNDRTSASDRSEREWLRLWDATVAMDQHKARQRLVMTHLEQDSSSWERETTIHLANMFLSHSPDFVRDPPPLGPLEGYYLANSSEFRAADYLISRPESSSDDTAYVCCGIVEEKGYTRSEPMELCTRLGVVGGRIRLKVDDEGLVAMQEGWSAAALEQLAHIISQFYVNKTRWMIYGNLNSRLLLYLESRDQVRVSAPIPRTGIQVQSGQQMYRITMVSLLVGIPLQEHLPFSFAGEEWYDPWRKASKARKVTATEAQESSHRPGGGGRGGGGDGGGGGGNGGTGGSGGTGAGNNGGPDHAGEENRSGGPASSPQPDRGGGGSHADPGSSSGGGWSLSHRTGHDHVSSQQPGKQSQSLAIQTQSSLKLQLGPSPSVDHSFVKLFCGSGVQITCIVPARKPGRLPLPRPMETGVRAKKSSHGSDYTADSTEPPRTPLSRLFPDDLSAAFEPKILNPAVIDTGADFAGSTFEAYRGLLEPESPSHTKASSNVIVKICSLYDEGVYNEEVYEAALAEATMYQEHLDDLQGVFVPEFYGLWKGIVEYTVGQFTSVYECLVVVLEDVGSNDLAKEYETFGDLPEADAESVKMIYEELGQRNIYHGDIELRHIFRSNDGRSLRIIDFDRAGVDHVQTKAERKWLDEAMAGRKG